MPDEYSQRDFGRLEALTRCLTPRTASLILPERRDAHQLQRALLAGFRPAVRRKLARLAERADLDADRAGKVQAAVDELPQTWWFDADELEILVTGFGPFLDNARNPSWDVAQAFGEALSANVSTSCERIRVTHDEAAAFAKRAGIEQGQRLVVHFGLRASRPDIALERYAHNCRGQTRDESGRDGWSDVVVPGGPAALETLLPVRNLAGRLDEDLRSGAISTDDDELAVQMSRDVGDYVCNSIYYHSLCAVRAARRAGRAAEALFVHVPRLDADRARDVGARFGKLFDAHLKAALTGTPLA